MSLTGVSSIINKWIEKGLEWRWFWRPVMRPFTIPANGTIQIPSSEYTFRADEGTLLTFNGVFDHPSCGIRVESHPELDTGDVFTANVMTAVGFTHAAMYITSLIPPQTPSGIYAISQQKEWPFTDWARLYLFNTDSVDHRCLRYSYTLALLRTPQTKKMEAGM